MMDAEQLVARLSAETGTKSRFAPTRTILIGALAAFAIAVVSSIILLSPRPDLAASAATPIFLIKIMFAMSVVFGAGIIVRDLSIPGRKPRWWLPLTAAPFFIIALMAIEQTVLGHPTGLEHDAKHASLIACLWQIGLLGLPAFVVISLIVRSMAPTNLVRTGVYVGLLSGAIGAVGYVFHCSDDYVAFVALGYTLAMLLMAGIGGLLGPRILRW